MNQALKSVVQTIPTNSEDYSMVQSLCTHVVDRNVTNSEDGKWAAFQKLLVKVRETVCFDTLFYETHKLAISTGFSIMSRNADNLYLWWL